MVVREGDNVTLSCDASGYPPPHIVWRREDGDDILLNGKKLNILEGAKLRLEKISRLNMGDYLCVASNGIPPSASNRFSIKVQCKVTIYFPARSQSLPAQSRPCSGSPASGRPSTPASRASRWSATVRPSPRVSTTGSTAGGRCWCLVSLSSHISPVGDLS